MTEDADIANAVLYSGLLNVARSKPGKRDGHCARGGCALYHTRAVTRTVDDATRLGKALGHEDLAKVEKAAEEMEAAAASLRRAVAWVREGNNGHG